MKSKCDCRRLRGYLTRTSIKELRKLPIELNDVLIKLRSRELLRLKKIRQRKREILKKNRVDSEKTTAENDETEQGTVWKSLMSWINILSKD